MKKWIFVFSFLMTFGMGTQSVHAANDGVALTVKESRSLVKEFRKGNFNKKTQLALNAMVGTAVDKLRMDGFTADADRYEKEWKEKYSNYFMSINVLDLGDHAPLNLWLVDFYKTLQKDVGDFILKSFHLDDINTANYAIPVVFMPKGDTRNGDHWDKPEYQKHFVPFASIVMYWACRGTCTGLTFGAGAIGMVCGLAAELPRYAMNKWIAPGLSDWVYDLATGKKNASFVLGEEAQIFLGEKN